MRKLIQFLALIVFITSCISSKKNSLEIKDPDNALGTVVKTLNENPDNETARKELQVVYTDIQRFHLSNIKSFKANNTDALPRWNDIILEYQALQNAYSLIMNSPAASQILQPHNYANDIVETKEAAAGHFYKEGLALLENSGRSNANKAYSYFNIADYYVPRYEEVKSKMNIAYQMAVINIVIDSLQDNSYFANSEWGQEGYDLSNEFFQKKLKTDLENASLESEYPIAFYSATEARENVIRKDWIISLDLIRMDINSLVSGGSSNYSVPPLESYENNLVTYIRPSGGQIISGPDPAPAASFGANDVFTYPPQKSQVIKYDNYGHNSSSLKVKMAFSIKNVATDKTISLSTLNGKNKFNQNDEYDDTGLVKVRFSDISDPNEMELAKSLEDIYFKIYPQIKDNLAVALK